MSSSQGTTNQNQMNFGVYPTTDDAAHNPNTNAMSYSSIQNNFLSLVRQRGAYPPPAKTR